MDRNQRMADVFVEFVGTAALAATIFGAPQIAAVLNLGYNALKRGYEGRAALEALTADIQAMTADGRAPTMEEFSALMARNAVAHDRIQSYGETQAPPDSPPPGNDGTETEPPIVVDMDVDLTTDPPSVAATVKDE